MPGCASHLRAQQETSPGIVGRGALYFPAFRSVRAYRRNGRRHGATARSLFLPLISIRSMRHQCMKECKSSMHGSIQHRSKAKASSRSFRAFGGVCRVRQAATGLQRGSRRRAREQTDDPCTAEDGRTIGDGARRRDGAAFGKPGSDRDVDTDTLLCRCSPASCALFLCFPWKECSVRPIACFHGFLAGTASA